MSVRLYPRIDEYPVPFKGTVRTPSVASGPDIVSKPRIWDHGVEAVLLETRPILRISTSGRAAIPATSTPPRAGTIPMPNSLFSSVYVTCKFADIEE